MNGHHIVQAEVSSSFRDSPVNGFVRLAERVMGSHHIFVHAFEDMLIGWHLRPIFLPLSEPEFSLLPIDCEGPSGLSRVTRVSKHSQRGKGWIESSPG